LKFSTSRAFHGIGVLPFRSIGKMANTVVRVMTIALAMLLQPALCMIEDEDPEVSEDPEGDAASDNLAAAKSRAADSAEELAGAVSKSVDDNAKAAAAQVVAEQKEGGGLIKTDPPPAIDFSEEDSPMLVIIKKDGLKNYDADGSGDLDLQEFRDIVHDLNPVDPIAKSDSEVDRLLKTWDTNHDSALSQEEVERMLAHSKVTVAKMNVGPSACNGWSPSEGPDAGRGASCQKWGFQVDWCWIDKDFSGAGKGRKWESDTFPGKFFAPCTPPALPASAPTPKPTPKPDKVAEKASEALHLAQEAMKQAEDMVAPNTTL
jgi:hypothetical protein